MSNTKRILLVLLAAAAIIGIVAIVRFRTPETNAPANAAANAPAALEPLHVNFDYHKNEPYTPQTIQVKQGQHVIVTVTTDVADEVHFHGYDLHVDAIAGDPATLEFDATQTGRFEIELETLQKTLGEFEIYPN